MRRRRPGLAWVACVKNGVRRGTGAGVAWSWASDGRTRTRGRRGAAQTVAHRRVSDRAARHNARQKACRSGPVREGGGDVHGRGPGEQPAMAFELSSGATPKVMWPCDALWPGARSAGPEPGRAEVGSQALFMSVRAVWMEVGLGFGSSCDAGG